MRDMSQKQLCSRCHQAMIPVVGSPDLTEWKFRHMSLAYCVVALLERVAELEELLDKSEDLVDEYRMERKSHEVS